MDVASRSSLCNANWEHGARACGLLSLAFLGLAWLRLVVVWSLPPMPFLPGASVGLFVASMIAA